MAQRILIHKILFAILLGVVKSDTRIDSVHFIDNRLDRLNTTLVITQHKVVSLEFEITSVSNSHQVDIRKLLSQLVAVTNEVESISHAVEENRLAIDGLTNTIETLEDELTKAIDLINNLNAMNLLWRHNFQIVNRTFTVLKNSGCLGSTVFQPFNVLHKIVNKNS